jgi:hypothetical protein
MRPPWRKYWFFDVQHPIIFVRAGFWNRVLWLPPFSTQTQRFSSVQWWPVSRCMSQGLDCELVRPCVSNLCWSVGLQLNRLFWKGHESVIMTDSRVFLEGGFSFIKVKSTTYLEMAWVECYGYWIQLVCPSVHFHTYTPTQPVSLTCLFFNKSMLCRGFFFTFVMNSSSIFSILSLFWKK